ncbi:MAG: hypothetical protein M1834_006470 [Cirrosporium novae-zelandiae]|nr:MAG: hypothetical protein M1834_006470 [Cirrosporium novae-zelandiae]
MTVSPIDFYKVLEISPTATQQQIREAYKRAALKSHPDRVPANSSERPARTKKFQQVNDAYYTLSDRSRRRDYDAAHKVQTPLSSGAQTPSSADEDIPRPEAGGAAPGGFPWSAFGFGGGQSSSGGYTPSKDQEAFSSAQFGDVFEEMLKEEGMADSSTSQPTSKFWSIIGGLSGAAMGFIVGNMPGAVAGVVAGNRLGAIRDKKGKSVYEVFAELPQGDRARILSQLAAKIIGGAVGI